MCETSVWLRTLPPHVEDAIHCCDVREEGVSQSRALCCTLDQPRNVHNVEVGRVL